MQATFHIKRERMQHFHIEHYRQMDGFLHFHSPIEILLVRKGVAEVWIGGEYALLRANDIAVVPSYEAHQFHSAGEGAECTDLFIPPHLCPAFSEAMQYKRAHHPFLRDGQTAQQIRTAAKELEREDLNSIEQQGYIQVILGAVLRSLTLEELHTPQDTDLPTKLLFYIHEHYKEEITTVTLARALGYSPSHLAKAFRTRFRLCIGQYVNTVRLKNAVMLMRKGGRSMTDCALESGFLSLRTFYRVFAEEFGCAPRDYLKQENALF